MEKDNECPLNWGQYKYCLRTIGSSVFKGCVSIEGQSGLLEWFIMSWVSAVEECLLTRFLLYTSPKLTRKSFTLVLTNLDIFHCSKFVSSCRSV